MKDADMKRAIRQHLEMDSFFTGGFTLKGDKADQASAGAAETICKAAAELGKIAEEVHCCHKCEIGYTRTNAVPGEGSPNAGIMFVGEGPGVDEDTQGRPFVGRAGQLLDKIMAAMGLKRSEVYICNILKCRPPANRNPE